ncbi:MAG: hypothetical protein LKG36_01390 [[Lactobacillus] timonensis]|nr:hypothetical protein [[Lactobacillus] timonensis]
MRRPQKTEQQADRLSRIGLENRKYTRARIRQYIWKQWKKFKTKVTNLQKLGLSYRDAFIFASTRKGYWRTAHSKTLNYSGSLSIGTDS